MQNSRADTNAFRVQGCTAAVATYKSWEFNAHPLPPTKSQTSHSTFSPPQHTMASALVRMPSSKKTKMSISDVSKATTVVSSQDARTSESDAGDLNQPMRIEHASTYLPVVRSNLQAPRPIKVRIRCRHVISPLSSGIVHPKFDKVPQCCRSFEPPEARRPINPCASPAPTAVPSY